MQKDIVVWNKEQKTIHSFFLRLTRVLSPTWLQHTIMNFLMKHDIWLIGMSILLGRALVLSNSSPFAIPFYAAMILFRPKRKKMVFLSLLIGSTTDSLSHLGYTFASLLVYQALHLIWKRSSRSERAGISFRVYCTVLMTKWFLLFIGASFQWSLYDFITANVEATLSFILTFLFIQAIPHVSPFMKKKALKSEEMISLIILLSSVMTGTIGWVMYGLSVDHVLARYVVLLFALVAGASVGSTVGVVAGLVFSMANGSSLYQMSLLAFAGVMGGLLKEGKKAGTSVGLLIATLMIGVYGEANVELAKTMYESLVAIGLLILTPTVWIQQAAKYMPGTPEYVQDQLQYMRKIRDITSQRISQFSTVFQALSNSFSEVEPYLQEEVEERELDDFLSRVTEKTCQTCFKKEQCWTRQFHTTYDWMSASMHEYRDGSPSSAQKIVLEGNRACVRTKRVEEAIQQELAYLEANRKLKRQVKESRRLVADQLLGVSEVMGDFANEIKKERENHQAQEEEILESLQEVGIDIDQVDIYNLDPGNVDMDVRTGRIETYGEGEKLIAPMLSDLLGETIVMKCQEMKMGNTIETVMTLRSARSFIVETGVAHAAKGGGLISGDSYSMLEMGVGKFAVAISDGMGNGERAHKESHETLNLLQKILQSGIDERAAIKSINSILALRTTDDIFSTLDLAIIDLRDANAEFLKIGSVPTFIKRGNKIMEIEGRNLPIGILNEFEVDVITEQLKAGDILIMMSDGVFDGPRDIENSDLWIRRKIRELTTEEPQELADLLLEEIIRTSSGNIQDDMTIIVSKIERHTPKWASIPVWKTKHRVS
jgi:stage II sporulation protein E